MGGCQRSGAVWLGVLAQFAVDPAAAVVEWSKLTDAEYALWRQSPGRTSAEIVGSLLRFQVAWLHKLGKREQSAPAIQRLLDLEDNGDAESLTDLAQWLVDRKVWSGFDELAGRFSARFDHDARLVYLVAEAYAERGDPKRAEETALRAFRIAARQTPDADEDNPRQTAAWLQQRGRIAWARREFARAIAALEKPSASLDDQRDGAITGIYLGEMLHDQGADLDAAQALERILGRLDSPAGSRRRPGYWSIPATPRNKFAR